MEPEAFIRSHLGEIHRVRSSSRGPTLTLEKLILDHGRFYEFSPLPESVESGLPRECFRNAALLVAADDSLIYCEGYAIPHTVDLPLEHAWCITRDGKVVDPTWDGAQGYFGIAFDRDYVLDTVARTQMVGVINNYKEKWPLLRLPPEKFLASLDFGGPEL